MLKISLAFIILIVIFFFDACKYSELNNPVSSVTKPDSSVVTNHTELIVEWADLKSVKLKIKPFPADSYIKYNFKFLRNDSLFFTCKLKSDTSFIDDNGSIGYGQGTTIKYKVEVYDSSRLIDTSRTVEAKTLYQGTNQIDWEIDTLGSGINRLYDCWAADTNDVWATGWVNIEGVGTNLIRYDGTKWYPLTPKNQRIAKIFGFSREEVVLVGGEGYGYVGFKKGDGWEDFSFLDTYPAGDTIYELQAIWGTDMNNLWAVGNNGTIAHWNGTDWSRAKEVNIKKLVFSDIWGFSKDNIYAWGKKSMDGEYLYHYDGFKWQLVFKEPFREDGKISLWGPHKDLIYLIEYNPIIIKNGIKKYEYIPNIGQLYKIRGDSETNIFSVGANGSISHYDGVRWQLIDLLHSNEFCPFFGCFVKNNIVFIVGATNYGALVVKGKILQK